MPHAQINGVKLHYRADGPEDGPTLLLSNSLASTLAMWDPQVPALTAAGWRVVRYDSRGHGQSSIPDGPYSIKAMTDDAVGLMDALDVATFAFCGLSMGGMVGQRLGSAHGDRLQALVLCDTAAQMPPPSLWDERIATVREQGMAGFVDATIDRWFTKPGQQTHADAVARIRKDILATPPDGFCNCGAAIRDMDQRESITAIAAPTLVIVGEDDAGTPVSAAEFIQQQIAGSQLTVIPEAAHLCNIEQADAFNAALLGFLQANR
jgi:3-oxoadipate enol-lactonase